MKDRYKFYETGFHGDSYLLQIVNMIMPACTFFIETGTNVASTLANIARTYPETLCLSCEPDTAAYERAVKNAGYSNVTIFNELSQQFLDRLQHRYSHLFFENGFFWLDAHGYGFKWPLKDELSFITANFRKAFILIDDFKVPGINCFGFDAYENQECSLEYIQDALNRDVRYNIYFPNYREKTSPYHPLRGWVLIDFGHINKLKLSDSLAWTYNLRI